MENVRTLWQLCTKNTFKSGQDECSIEPYLHNTYSITIQTCIHSMWDMENNKHTVIGDLVLRCTNFDPTIHYQDNIYIHQKTHVNIWNIVSNIYCTDDWFGITVNMSNRWCTFSHKSSRSKHIDMKPMMLSTSHETWRAHRQQHISMGHTIDKSHGYSDFRFWSTQTWWPKRALFELILCQHGDLT